VAAALAAYQLRYLIVHLAWLGATLDGTSSRSGTVGAVVLLAIAAGLLLRHSGRGLAARVPRPAGWSLRFVGLWVLCTAVLAGLLGAAGLLHAVTSVGHVQPLTHSLVAGAWSAAPTVLSVGLLLAASLYGLRWLLFELGGERKRLGDLRALVSGSRVVSADLPPAVAPLGAGWSDRGPPASRLLAAF
jgi:hypothetical protein